MPRFTCDSLAAMEFVLHWQDDGFAHQEHYYARRVNAWRDIFPSHLRQDLEGAQPGDVVTCDIAPCETVAAAAPERVGVFPLRRFIRKTVAGRRISPHAGRFYPMGMLSGLPGVFPQTINPFRVLGIDGNNMTLDRNHPLAGRELALETRVLRVEDKRSETGGQMHHWLEEICNWGPGMQAPLPEGPTQFVDDRFFVRTDQSGDDTFYSKPRLIGHVDATASENLKRAYSRFLKPGMCVLDLMASVQSHLPQEMDLEVVGLGMNLAEMEQNPRLAASVVHDLNAAPHLPGEIGTFDAVVCSLSLEYLTDPLAVLNSVRQHLKPGGWVLVGFSNRWFPTKAVEGWLDLHDFERMGFVRQLLHEAGCGEKGQTMSFRNYPRPYQDHHFFETHGLGDPIFVVAVQKGVE